MSATAGINRLSWNLRPDGDADETLPRQMSVAPGTYTVTVSLGGEESSTSLEVNGDPRDPVSVAQYRAKVTAVQEMQAIVDGVDESHEELQETGRRVELVLETLPDDAGSLRTQGEALRDAIRGLLEQHFTGPVCQGNCRGILTVSRVQAPMGRVLGETGRPSENTRLMIEQARAAAQEITGDVATLMNGHVASYRNALQAAGYSPLGGPGGDL